ncbi:hypothetical protein U1Q18_010479 [Sarracenia purpurea var. burkii]
MQLFLEWLGHSDLSAGHCAVGLDLMFEHKGVLMALCGRHMLIKGVAQWTGYARSGGEALWWWFPCSWWRSNTCGLHRPRGGFLQMMTPGRVLRETKALRCALADWTCCLMISLAKSRRGSDRRGVPNSC